MAAPSPPDGFAEFVAARSAALTLRPAPPTGTTNWNPVDDRDGIHEKLLNVASF